VDTDRKVVLITGAARGMGRAQAVALARDGFDVIATDHRPEAAVASGRYAPLAEDFAVTVAEVEAVGGTILTADADVTRQEDLDKAVTTGLDRFGRLDCLVATAGVGNPYKPSWELTEEEFRLPIEVNLLGAWHATKAVIPAMIEAGRGGSVIVIGSGASVKGLLNMTAYVSSKHGQIGLVKTLAREAGPYGIRVNAVLPGNTNTQLFMQGNSRYLLVPEEEEPSDEVFLARAAQRSPMRIPYVEVDDVAAAVCWLASDAARFVTGTAIPVDGGTAIP
jgi:(+)-trans-carveol dehydrogenase